MKDFIAKFMEGLHRHKWVEDDESPYRVHGESYTQTCECGARRCYIWRRP